MSDGLFRNSDWDRIRVAIFDVDGTLYDQNRMRLIMLKELALHSLLHTETRTLRILKAYRSLREKLSDEEVEGFNERLVTETARAAGCSERVVSETVADWIGQRPLKHLLRCRYLGIADLFKRIKSRGTKLAVLSDYPADSKIEALKLHADFLVSADTPEVQALKPNPKGLQYILNAMNVNPEEAIMIGDRIDRDGEVAHRVGVSILIRSSKAVAGFQTFSSYQEPIFDI